MRTRQHSDQHYHLTTLSGGVGLALTPLPHAQSVAVGVWVRAGGRYETPEHAGISHMLEHLLFKGTRTRSCEALKRQIEGVGGSLNGFTAEEFTCYMAKVPQRHLRRTIRVLADMMQHPTLSPHDLEKEREVILEEIRMSEDTPGQTIHDLFNELLWPNHPLGTLLSGTVDTVRRITHRDVVTYWQQFYRPCHMVVAMAGAFDCNAVRREVQRTFRPLRAARRRRFPGAPRPRRGPQVRVWRKPTEQTHLCLGTYAIPRTHPQRFALELLHVLLGANMSSRLFREVREKQGLVYEIGTHIKRFADTGAFVIYAGCEAEKVVATIRTIVRELRRLRHRAISASELRRAKDYYAGQLVMALDDPMEHMLWIGEQAVTVGRLWQPATLLAHMARVTARDVRQVARRLFLPERLHLALVGPIGEEDAGRLREVCQLT